MILSLITLAFCSKQYYDTQYVESEISHIGVLFAMRALPNLNLLACGFVGILSSCLAHKTAEIVYNTLAVQTTASMILLVWYFGQKLSTAKLEADRNSATKCGILSILSLSVCVGYLIYISIQLLISLRKESNSSDSSENLKNSSNDIIVA